MCVVDNKYENTVSKSGTANSSSDLEDKNVVDQNERECEDSLNEESVQREEFSRDVVVGEENASLVLLAVSYTHLDVYKRQESIVGKEGGFLNAFHSTRQSESYMVPFEDF